jgi:predicted transcriptional regulator
MTLLGRLADKGVLKVSRERQPYRFSTAITREQVLRQRVRDFVIRSPKVSLWTS